MSKRIIVLLLLAMIAQCIFAGINMYSLSITAISKNSENIRYSFDNENWVETKEDTVLLTEDEVKNGKIVFQQKKNGEWGDPIVTSINFLEHGAKKVDVSWNLIPGKSEKMEWSSDGKEWNSFPTSGQMTLKNVKVGDVAVVYFRQTANGQVSEPVMVGSVSLSNLPRVRAKETKSQPVFSIASGASYSVRNNRFQNGDTMHSKGSFGAWLDFSVAFNDWFALSVDGRYERHTYKPFTFNEIVADIKSVLIIPTSSSLYPFISIGIGEGYFWNDYDKAFNPSLNCSIGCVYSLPKNISLLLSADYSATFTHESELNPNSLIDSINQRFGVKVGCAISFGKGVNQ